MNLKLVLLITLLFAFLSSPAMAKMELRAKGMELCYKCHEDLKTDFKKAHVHTPVKEGNCIGCHNPHTSDHGKLLDEDSR